MSPAFTGFNVFKDMSKLVEKAKTLGLTPIIEELNELQLLSTGRKIKDDFDVAEKG
jgi:hypothetical protein